MVAALEAPGTRVLAYLVAAAMCATAGIVRTRRRPGQVLSEGAFWFGLCALIVCLVVFREGGLQESLADAGRRFAKSHGWYAERRVYQAATAAALMTTSGFVLLIALVLLGARRRSFGFPIVAVGALLCFIAVRALSLHQTDALLYRRSLHGVQINVLLELGLIGLVALSALVAIIDKAPEKQRQRRNGQV